MIPAVYVLAKLADRVRPTVQPPAKVRWGVAACYLAAWIAVDAVTGFSDWRPHGLEPFWAVVLLGAIFIAGIIGPPSRGVFIRSKR